VLSPARNVKLSSLQNAPKALFLTPGTSSALDMLEARNAQMEDSNMLHWAAVFFVIALLAAVFGFGGIAASAAGVAKILFLVFLVLAVVSLIFGRRVST
jgi:uncharacterized membrane protein YtjA (UPF0391 family)